MKNQPIWNAESVYLETFCDIGMLPAYIPSWNIKTMQGPVTWRWRHHDVRITSWNCWSSRCSSINALFHKMLTSSNLVMLHVCSLNCSLSNQQSSFRQIFKTLLIITSVTGFWKSCKKELFKINFLTPVNDMNMLLESPFFSKNAYQNQK